MKKLAKIISLMLAIVLVLAVTGCSGQKKITIGIIQYMDHVALDNAREGFIEALKENGYVDGENIKID